MGSPWRKIWDRWMRLLCYCLKVGSLSRINHDKFIQAVWFVRHFVWNHGPERGSKIIDDTIIIWLFCWIISKLPQNLLEKWINHAASYKKKYNVTFQSLSVLAEFVHDQSRIRNDPRFQFAFSTTRNVNHSLQANEKKIYLSGKQRWK